MTNKLVVIINSFKVPKIKKLLLYEIKFLVPNYSCLQNPWLGGYRLQISVLSVLDRICWIPLEKNSWVLHWLLVRFCGFVPLVVGGFSAIPVHGTGLLSKQLVMLRWDSSRIMFVKYVKVAGKQIRFLEPIFSNGCCGRLQVSFPNHSSNSIVCNNSVWMVFQPNFYLLYVASL